MPESISQALSQGAFVRLNHSPALSGYSRTACLCWHHIHEAPVYKSILANAFSVPSVLSPLNTRFSATRTAMASPSSSSSAIAQPTSIGSALNSGAGKAQTNTGISLQTFFASIVGSFVAFGVQFTIFLLIKNKLTRI